MSSQSTLEARNNTAAGSGGRSRARLAVAPVLAALAIGLLAGCANRDSVTVGSIPDDYRTNHPIVISEKNETLDLPVAASARGITQSQRVTLLDPSKLGLHINVFIHVTLENQNRDGLDALEAAVTALPNVMECYLMSGDADYLLRVMVSDMSAYETLITDRLSRIPGIRKWPEAYLPKIFDRARVDRTVSVTQAEAEIMARRLAAEEGIFCGISAAGACQIALNLAHEVENATIVFVVCDRGDRYLSTGVFPA